MFRMRLFSFYSVPKSVQSPYGHLVERGFHMGFRKMDSGTETWVAQFQNRWGIIGRNGKEVRFVFHP